MSQEEWLEESSKPFLLFTIFACVANIDGIEAMDSISYIFNKSIFENIPEQTTSDSNTQNTYSNAIEFAKNSYDKEPKFEDSLFTITTKK